jgi:hypothetical protein
MTGYDAYDALLYFFAHIARVGNKGKEIGEPVICVMESWLEPLTGCVLAWLRCAK